MTLNAGEKMDIAKEDLIRLAEEYETPFYYYDGNDMHDRYHAVRQILDNRVDIFLSLKANPNVALAKLFQSWGSGVEVASIGELSLALAAGYSPEQIIFSGPGKRITELKAAIEANIYSIIAESLQELEHIQSLSREKGKITKVAVRINPDNDLSPSSIKMAGIARQFGIDESQLDSFFNTLKACPNVCFSGIHVYLGTQNLKDDRILDGFKYTIKIADQLYEKYGVECNIINFGGGFGIPYFPHEQPLDMKSLIHELNQLISSLEHKIYSKTRFIIESGRYLLAQSGAYVVKILYSKISKGERFYIVDGGMHHNAGATFRGRFIRNNYEIKAVPMKKNTLNPPMEKANVVGPLCTPEDCLGKSVVLEHLEPGDLIYVLDSGAYGLTYSPHSFLSHQMPLELLKWHDQYFVIRRREEDMVHHVTDISPQIIY